MVDAQTLHTSSVVVICCPENHFFPLHAKGDVGVVVGVEFPISICLRVQGDGEVSDGQEVVTWYLLIGCDTQGFVRRSTEHVVVFIVWRLDMC